MAKKTAKRPAKKTQCTCKGKRCNQDTPPTPPTPPTPAEVAAQLIQLDKARQTLDLTILDIVMGCVERDCGLSIVDLTAALGDGASCRIYCCVALGNAADSLSTAVEGLVQEAGER